MSDEKDLETRNREEQEQAELERDALSYNAPEGHSKTLAALIGQLTSGYDWHRGALGEESLKAIAEDLDVLWGSIGGEHPMTDRALADTVFRIARRAEAASEVCRRLERANAKQGAAQPAGNTPRSEVARGRGLANEVVVARSWLESVAELIRESVDELRDAFDMLMDNPTDDETAESATRLFESNYVAALRRARELEWRAHSSPRAAQQPAETSAAPRNTPTRDDPSNTLHGVGARS